MSYFSATGHTQLKKNQGQNNLKMNQLLQTLLRHQCDFWRDDAPKRDAGGNASDIHILALCFRCISNGVCIEGEVIICQVK